MCSVGSSFSVVLAWRIKACLSLNVVGERFSEHEREEPGVVLFCCNAERLDSEKQTCIKEF